MAVPALELRPRGPVALFDAALRLSARVWGLWAATLPGAALVTAALLWWVDCVLGGRSVEAPSLALTLAWLLRAVCQGAGCHFVEQQLVSVQPPSVLESLRLALGRAPS